MYSSSCSGVSDEISLSSSNLWIFWLISERCMFISSKRESMSPKFVPSSGWTGVVSCFSWSSKDFRQFIYPSDCNEGSKPSLAFALESRASWWAVAFLSASSCASTKFLNPSDCLSGWNPSLALLLESSASWWAVAFLSASSCASTKFLNPSDCLSGWNPSLAFALESRASWWRSLTSGCGILGVFCWVGIAHFEPSVILISSPWFSPVSWNLLYLSASLSFIASSKLLKCCLIFSGLSQ